MDHLKGARAMMSVKRSSFFSLVGSDESLWRSSIQHKEAFGGRSTKFFFIDFFKTRESTRVSREIVIPLPQSTGRAIGMRNVAFHMWRQTNDQNNFRRKVDWAAPDSRRLANVACETREDLCEKLLRNDDLKTKIILRDVNKEKHFRTKS